MSIIVNFYLDLSNEISKHSSQTTIKCNLREKLNSNELFLVGEQHDSPLSIEAKQRIFNLSQKNKVRVLTEVGLKVAALPAGHRVFKDLYGPIGQIENIEGIESPIFYSLSTSYMLQVRNIEGKVSAQSLARELSLYIKYSPLYRLAHESLKLEARYGEIQMLIEDYLSRLPVPVEVEEADNFPYLSQKNQRKVREFLTAMHKKMIEFVVKTFPQGVLSKKLPYLLTRMDIDEVFFPRGERKIDPFFLKERDLRFATQIRDALCAQVNGSNRIVILVGDDHVMGVLEHIKAWAGEKFAYTYFKSNDREGIEKLYGDLLREN